LHQDYCVAWNEIVPEVRPKFITLCNSIKVALRRLKRSVSIELASFESHSARDLQSYTPLNSEQS
jgi:hypothetical protein